MQATESQSPVWGEWMGAWKSGSEVDKEAERVDRQKAAVGGDTLSKLKDLNVLIIGCRGVGTETAKNLILSNVGAVGVIDDAVCCTRDLGANCYISADDVSLSRSRSAAVLPQLKSLNPFCKVEIFPSADNAAVSTKNFLGTNRPISAIVLTVFTAKSEVIRLDEICRKENIAFIFAVNSGVTSFVFSDFGPNHAISDKNGNPVQEIPIAGVEIMNLPPNLRVPGFKEGDEVVILTMPKPVSNPVDGGAWPESGSQIQFDDMSAALCRSGLKFNVEPVEIVLAGTDAAVEESKKPEFQQMLSSMSCHTVADMHLKKFKTYEAEYEALGTGKKMPTRIYTLRTRVAVVFPKETPSSSSAEDYIQSFKAWVNGGFMKQILQEIHMPFASFADGIEKTPNPTCLMQERSDLGLGIDTLLAIEAAFQFNSSFGRWPTLGSLADAKQVLEFAKNISDSRASAPDSGELCYAQKVEYGFCSGEKRDLDEHRITQFAQLFEAELVGFCSFLGGVVAQEAMKKIGKFTPISGWLIHEDYDLVRASDVPTLRAPLFGSRFDYQIAVLGKDFQSRIGSQKIFLVGCGALGCEYMKALALMGAGSGHGGKVIVVDMDTIEVSNLSRQFLFREDDVKKYKSSTAARVVKSWVPSMNVEALQARVGLDSEHFFNDDFWQDIDICWNALDNVEARRYTDTRCLMYGKPLLESGTLGTKNNSEVAIPYVTQSYSDGNHGDDQENAIAMCTLRSFPYLPLHCIEMAKQQYFSELFHFGPQLYETFRQDQCEFFDQVDKMKDSKERLKFLQYVQSKVQCQKSGSIDFSLCVRMAFDGMTRYFRDGILDVIHLADTAEKKDQKPFWTGAKRKPRALEWGPHVCDPQQRALAMEFLYASSNMNAYVWGVEPIRNRNSFEEFVGSLNLQQGQWKLSDDSVLLEPGAEAAPDASSSSESRVESQIDAITQELYSVDVSSLIQAHPHDFEKDDDSNFHIDFLTVATNARAWNYNIKQSTRHEVKVTAGKIIPAMATTTSAICGLVDIEFCKLVLGLQHSLGSSPFINFNMDLAVPTFNAFRPVDAKQFNSPLGPTCSWDMMEISETEAPTLQALLGSLSRRYGLEVEKLSVHLGVHGKFGKELYSSLDKKKLNWEVSVSEDEKTLITGGSVLKDSPWSSSLLDYLTIFPKLGRELPVGGNTHKNMLVAVRDISNNIAKVKKEFYSTLSAGVKQVYVAKCRPKDHEPNCEEAQELFDRTLSRRSHLFFQVQLSYEPTIACGTVNGTIRGSGTKSKPWIATIIVNSTAGIAVGMSLSAQAGTGSIYSGEPDSAVVTSVVPNESITYQVVGGICDVPFEAQLPVAGSITDITGYYSDPLPVLKYTLSPGSS